MYRVLLVDDEGLELNSLKMIVSKEFLDEVEIETAMSGRMAIEVFDTFRPDIIVMDIQMPGINGIDAIREIRKVHSSGKFLVLTAYDNFEYVQEALNIGVSTYMTKPFNKKGLADELRKLMALVDKEKDRRREDLMLRERLDAATPMLEDGFIYSVIMGQDFNRFGSRYYNLLGYPYTHGFFCVMDFEIDEDVDSSIAFAAISKKIEKLSKEAFKDSITFLMGRQNLMLSLCNEPKDEYKTRLSIMSRATDMQEKLEGLTNVKTLIGIGSIVKIEDLKDSYDQAVSALTQGNDAVNHYKDLPIGKHWEEGYPSDTEYEIYEMADKGDNEGLIREAKDFYDWMVKNHAQDLSDIKLKVLELVMRVEYIIFHTGGRTYHFMERHGYLEEVNRTDSLDELRVWYLDHIKKAINDMDSNKEADTFNIIDEAKRYIKENFRDNLTLNEISEMVHVSPYYFSKLFKEKTGKNFIEYLTHIRMEYAKTQLRYSDMSIKDICLNAGFSDPNYFSRSFKKYEGVTPGEYREG